MRANPNNKVLDLAQEIVALIKTAEGRYEDFPFVGLDALWVAALAIYGHEAVRHVESWSVAGKGVIHLVDEPSNVAGGV